jgi:hypothetical protein
MKVSLFGPVTTQGVILQSDANVTVQPNTTKAETYRATGEIVDGQQNIISEEWINDL